jgi:hypothetical protein
MHYCPAHRLKLLVFFPVSGNVALKLLLPPLPVVLRQNAMVRAGVPETAIHEDRYLGRGERKIRATRQQWEIDPEAETATMQLTADEHFGPSRRPPHLLHLRRDGHIQRSGSLSTNTTTQISIPLRGEGLLHVNSLIKLSVLSVISAVPACGVAVKANIEM